MTEYVVLPIQDENGKAVNRSLRIDTRYFLGESAEVANRYIEMIDTNETEREAIELEYLDRIVHDLPTNNDWIGPALARTDKTNSWREHNRRNHIGEFAVDRSESHDISTIYPKMEWRTLEDFTGYQMNKNRMIVDKETQKTVAQEYQGTRVKVLLFDGRAGRLKTMDVDWLFKRTFPELAQ